MKNYRIIVLSSGEGLILQSIINKIHEKNKGIKIVLIVSDQPSQSINRGILANIPSLFFPMMKGQLAQYYDGVLKEIISIFYPDLIILSGYMKILSEIFIKQFRNIIINIHPSLLPNYKGTNTHERVISANEKIHGTTIHYVDETLDGGKIIDHKKIHILPTDTAITLEQKIKSIECEFYPQTIINIIKKLRSLDEK